MSVEELEQTGQAPTGDEQQDGQAVEAQEQGAAPAEPSDDAAFQAGFDTARTGGEPEPEPEPPKLIAGYTEDEVKGLLQKVAEVDRLKERESKVFGSLGALRQAVDALKAQPMQQAAAPLNIALKRLSQEYPEMAESLMEDLKESLGSGVGGQSFDPDAVSRIVAEKLADTSKSYELKLLSVMHPDWKAIPASPEFEQWKGTLTPDELQIVNDSWDAIAVGDTLTKFKAWKTQTSQAKQNRQSRLEAAATPTRGARTPTPSLTENDAFVAGWKSVRG